MVTPEDRLAEGIEALGIESSVARGIAELTVDEMRKRERARLSRQHFGDSLHAHGWAILFRLLHRFCTDDADWNSWGRAHAEVSRAVKNEALAEHRS